MATATTEKRLMVRDIMAAIEQMAPSEADELSRRILHLQARRKAPNLSKRETELLREIYREKRPGFQERFDALNTRCHAFTLTPEEHEEFLRLVDESEAFTVRRLEALVELAQLREMTLPALMKQLQIKAPPVV